ncbi:MULTISPECIES: GlxA family transcriptional regulator [Pseudomonas]|uniref:HTH-type transcriptional regulator CdhR n=1 Tax=Pseudomonas fluorescens TaxID=294 RepID=A0A5E6VPB9_PSEFL|nr:MULTISPECIES: helix-turn-helix domain-containing protein [Pseudomonas]VVN19865.1 HTH-type transcriptional regulator CdhR [Pseudomonas fluorescens]
MNDFTILVMPGAFASSVALTLDILSTAAVLAQRLGTAVPRWQVCGLNTDCVTLGHGMQLAVQPLAISPDDRSCWIIPGIGVADVHMIEHRLQQADIALLVPALRAHVQAGGNVAASCSAVFVLQAANLLAGHCVTTSWWMAPLLQQWAPQCQVDAERMVILDPPLITAGAALGHTDLMLHLLRSHFSPALADDVARALLIDGRQLQSPFMVPAMMAQGNELIAQLTAHIEASLPTIISVSTLASDFGLSERTLSRHIHKATGYSPLRLIQRVQANKARELLANSKYSIDTIAEHVGYRDATSLRRLMKKMLNATPRQLR